MGEQITVYAGDSILCCDNKGHSIAKPRIEGDHACDKDARIKKLDETYQAAVKRIDELLGEAESANVRIKTLREENWALRRRLLRCPERVQAALARREAEENG